MIKKYYDEKGMEINDNHPIIAEDPLGKHRIFCIECNKKIIRGSVRYKNCEELFNDKRRK